MTPAILAQLAVLASAEASALAEDPDGRIVVKDGWREHQPGKTGYRRLTDEELRECERLRAHGARLHYAAIDAGLRCECFDCLFGDGSRCLWLSHEGRRDDR